MKLPEKKPAEFIFKRFCDVYNSRDLNALLNLFTSNTNMWGTGLDEYRIGVKQIEEQIKRDWSQSEKSELKITSFVSSPNDASWAAAVCHATITIDGVEHVFDHLRGTIIIERENGVWKIAHMHASFPDYRNAAGGSFPVDK